MAYVDPDYKTKKAFKEAVARGVVHRPYNHGGRFPAEQNGEEFIEGPHYPRPHTWYVRVRVQGGVVTKVLSLKNFVSSPFCISWRRMDLS